MRLLHIQVISLIRWLQKFKAVQIALLAVWVGYERYLSSLLYLAHSFQANLFPPYWQLVSLNGQQL